jgi:hypothetical protein
MVSAFSCGELGFGAKYTGDQLDKVNVERRRGRRKNYVDEISAKQKNGTSKKKPLTESPFVRMLEYGANNDGYWTYEAIVLQMEDCVDCLQVLYPMFDFVFLFDHSNGHNRMKPDGLNF